MTGFGAASEIPAADDGELIDVRPPRPPFVICPGCGSECNSIDGLPVCSCGWREYESSSFIDRGELKPERGEF